MKNIFYILYVCTVISFIGCTKKTWRYYRIKDNADNEYSLALKKDGTVEANVDHLPLNWGERRRFYGHWKKIERSKDNPTSHIKITFDEDLYVSYFDSDNDTTYESIVYDCAPIFIFPANRIPDKRIYEMTDDGWIYDYGGCETEDPTRRIKYREVDGFYEDGFRFIFNDNYSPINYKIN